MAAYAASLPPSDSKLIESAGVPLFAGATFVQGGQGRGFSFCLKYAAGRGSGMVSPAFAQVASIQSIRRLDSL